MISIRQQRGVGKESGSKTEAQARANTAVHSNRSIMCLFGVHIGRYSVAGPYRVDLDA